MHLPGYKILRTIGKGGTAVVYLATEEATGRPTVLKVLKGLNGQPQTALDDTQATDTLRSPARLANEAALISSLSHPHIGGIYESGRTEDGRHFFAMELVRGETLDRPTASPTWPWST